jgi:hypothetical protein
MNKGLLGAIGGLGDALQTVGKDLGSRRERALEEARRLAAEQRKLAVEDQRRAEDKNFTRERDGASAAASMARTTAQIEARQNELGQRQEFERDERKANESFKEKQAREEREGRAALARLRSSLSRADDEASIRLRDSLGADDVKSIIYTNPKKDAGGNVYQEAVIVTKSGQQKPTGKWVLKNRARATDTEDEDDEEL